MVNSSHFRNNTLGFKCRNDSVLRLTHLWHQCAGVVTTLIAASVGLAISLTGGSVEARKPQVAGGLDFPFQALTLVEGTRVHSGPGQAHYATESLAAGVAVEVYREDPGGWCAIRPTPDSFSLVPASTLEMVGTDVGRVKSDGTQAWVGTALGVVDKPLWQVKLKAGELVEVLGEVNWPNPQGHSTTWLQISPPSGEFRWIRKSDLQLPPSLRGEQQVVQASEQSLEGAFAGSKTSQAAPVNRGNEPSNSIVRSRLQDASLERLAGQASSSPAFNQQLAANDLAPNDTTLGWRRTTRAMPVAGQREPERNDANFSPSTFTSNPDAGFYSSADRSASSDRPVELQQPANRPVRYADADSSTPSLATQLAGVRLAGNQVALDGSEATVSPFELTMAQLEMKLNEQMLKEPAEWDLQELEIGATSLRQRALAADEAAAAERFMGKLERCRSLRSDYQATQRRDSMGSVSGGSAPIGSGIDTNVELGTRFDAHGWLNELVTAGGTRESSFVLQTDGGQITHHVTAAPGLNLRRYLKKRVGIIGARGWDERLKLDHVTAARVVTLD